MNGSRGCRPFASCFRGWELKAYFDYTEKQNISDRLYLDYLNACNKLGIDMSLKQNRLPKDFMYWHDLRIDQYAEQKAIEEANKKQELMQKFSEVAEKYLPLQHNKRSAFICVIARSPADLIKEGRNFTSLRRADAVRPALCTGRIAHLLYPRKRAAGKALVTLEYSLKTHKVLQCYASHNKKPDDDILHYVNKVWLPYANKHLKQIQAAA